MTSLPTEAGTTGDGARQRAGVANKTPVLHHGVTLLHVGLGRAVGHRSEYGKLTR